jgi:3-dehydroquinate synthase
MNNNSENYQTINIKLPHHHYPILIGNALLGMAGNYIRHYCSTIPSCFIITDTNVGPLHLTTLYSSLRDCNIKNYTITVPAGEESKSFVTAEKIIQQILSHRPERNSIIIALGGGVIGDLSGFIASILLRGIRFVQIPTTLLAQVDSSVGGKTGINTNYGKNLVGTFYQPHLVLADLDLLQTLPKRHWLAGYAEIIKYGLIQRHDFFTHLCHNAPLFLAQDKQHIAHAVAISCQTKADIVIADEKEHSLRALLNFGHTFGHALEAEIGFNDQLLHGEAVAIGMVLACKLSNKLGLLPEASTTQLIQHLHEVGLPASIRTLTKHVPEQGLADRLLTHMYHDKKVQHGHLVFILLDAIGKARVVDHVDPKLVHQLLMESVL